MNTETKEESKQRERSVLKGREKEEEEVENNRHQQ